MIEVGINAIYMKALRHVAAIQDIRYYLNGVCIQFRDDATYYVATNGHALAAIRDAGKMNPEDIRGRDVIVPKEFLERLPRLPSGASKASFILDGAQHRDEVRLRVTGLEDGIFRHIDGRFPKWNEAASKVLPKAEPDGTQTPVQPRYLSQIESVYQEAFVHARALAFLQNGPEKPAYIVGTDDRFIGVVMPLTQAGTIPAWAMREPVTA